MLRGVLVVPVDAGTDTHALLMAFDDAVMVLCGVIKADGFVITPGMTCRVSAVLHPVVLDVVDEAGNWNYAAMTEVMVAAELIKE